MDSKELERVRELNYDHHRRMTELAAQHHDKGTLDAILSTDDTSYKTLLRTVPKNRTHILELGSSLGGQFPLLQGWLTAGGKISGIDLFEPNVRKAQEAGLSIATGFVEDMNMFANGMFDLVCSRHVMEHLGDLEHGMAEVIRVTKVGGYIAHVTPDLAVDNEPSHLNKFDLQMWAVLWIRAGVTLLSAKRHSFHGGEVHIVGRRR